MVARHLRRIHGPDLTGAPLNRMIDEVFASYARYWAESLRLPGLSGAQVDAGFSGRGIDEIDLALEAGRGAVLALPHLGGWEWGGTWLAQTGHPVTVVVEQLRSAELFEWFVSFRRRLGMEVVPLGPGAGSAALRALRANRVVCLLCDRVVAQTPGVEVVFFGERTQLPAGPATLAMRAGAALLPAAVYFGASGDDHIGLVRPPLVTERAGRFRDDVVTGTQRVAAELEWLIRQAPTQWHLLQPNWPSDAPD
jgi:KDO2-lipid IV(A) lauroyltransferase